MTGQIFNIQKFSIHDGPGIRTTVFLKGCSMHCAWCHNPESIARHPEIVFFPNKCIGCRRCFGACPSGALSLVDDERRYARDDCRLCGRCAEACYAEAIVMEGREVTTEEVVAEILKDKPFYDNSNGGATCSGGEPLLQADFVAEVFASCHDQGVHTALDTAAHVAWDAFETVLPDTDLVLLDLKVIDPERHREATGVDNTLVLANARRLAETGLPLIVRVPVIPGYTDAEDNIAAIAAFVRDFPNLEQIELLPYHCFAEAKYQRLERAYPLKGSEPPPKDQLQHLVDVIEGHGVKAKAG
ncbi:glycyl-radical enzyme activating protein [Planctomycetota bacterium]